MIVCRFQFMSLYDRGYRTSDYGRLCCVFIFFGGLRSSSCYQNGYGCLRHVQLVSFTRTSSTTKQKGNDEKGGVMTDKRSSSLKSTSLISTSRSPRVRGSASRDHGRDGSHSCAARDVLDVLHSSILPLTEEPLLPPHWAAPCLDG